MFTTIAIASVCACRLVFPGTECEAERKEWYEVMQFSTMALYVADPEVFLSGLWIPAAALANCMNEYFEREQEALAVHLVSTVPDEVDPYNYVEGKALPIKPRFLYYNASVVGLHANKQVLQAGGSPLIAQLDNTHLDGLCCLTDFAFVLKAPRAFGDFSIGLLEGL